MDIRQLGLGIVGAVIGFFAYGGPYGAIYGFQLGIALGAVAFPPDLPKVIGPRLTDLVSTGAQLGAPIPIIYGTIAVPGTVIYASCVTEIVSTEEVGGKGGGEQEVTTYTYTQTIALGLCEGEIGGVLRIWENGELVYDVRPQLEDEDDEAFLQRWEASRDYEATFSLYFGDEEQLADPDLETLLGVGNVPAYRGLAYLVYPNRLLADDQGRRVPNFRVEVFRGRGGRDVVPPTNLIALAGWQNNVLLVDWIRGRYFTMTAVGLFDPFTGLRAYSLYDNVEYANRTFDDMLLDISLGTGGWTLGLDGYIYFTGFVTLSGAAIWRIDPETLGIAAQGAAGTSYVSSATTVRLVGPSGSTEFYVGVSFLTNGFGDLRAWQIPGMSLVSTANTLRDHGIICRAGTRGTFSSDLLSQASAYILCWDSVSLGATGPEVRVVRFDARYARLPLINQGLLWHQLTAIQPSDIDPAWVAISDIEGLVYDEADRTLIFAATGHTAGSVQSTYLVKWQPGEEGDDVSIDAQPDEASLIWAIPNWVQSPGEQNNTNLSQVTRYPRYAAPFGQNIRVVNTATGTVEVQDWSDDYPGSSGVSVSTWVYDARANVLIVFLSGVGPTLIFLDRQIQEPVSLANIVNDICDRSGLLPDEYNTVDLEARAVEGYALASTTNGRSAIEPLRVVGFFDAVESEGVLVFPTRGKALVATLAESDLGVHEPKDQPPPAVTTKKMQDVECPRMVRVKYIAQSREYEPGEQYSPTRITSDAVHDMDVEVPVSITDDMAAQVAEVMWSTSWASRWVHQVSLDASYLALDPADAIGVPVDGRIYRTRILAIEDKPGALIRRLDLVRDDDGSYVSQAVADTPQLPISTIIAVSSTAFVLLDLPLLRDADDDAGFYAAAYRSNPARSWTGAVIYRSIDSGASYQQIASVTNEATVGHLTAALPAGITSTWDEANEVEVELASGSFESRTEEAVLAGANALAIGEDGRWEIVQFLNAEQVSSTRWNLSGLLRGRRATEHNVGTSEVGDTVVLISGLGIIRIGLDTSQIGAERLYKAVTFGTTVGSAIAQAFAGSGEALEPFSPVHIHGTRAANGDLTIEWTRRGRIGQELADGADIALSEETESYEVDVLDPGSPGGARRTLSSTTTSVTYTAAQQIADGFSLGQLIPVEVYQLSATVGRGTPGSATI